MQAPEPAYDHEGDLSDLWAEIMDPENEIGDGATGLFTVERDYEDEPYGIGHGEYRHRRVEVVELTLVGVRVRGADYTYHLSRAECIDVFGAKAVSRFEEEEAERLSE